MDTIEKPGGEIADLDQRLEHLERAVLLLANHVGAVGWNYELQRALDRVREVSWRE